LELACSATDVVPLVDGSDSKLSFDAQYLRDTVIGVRTTDAVDRAGYYTPQGEDREWWRVVRDGDVLATFLLSNAGGGSIATSSACKGSGIGGV
jgi:hypothetical protein